MSVVSSRCRVTIRFLVSMSELSQVKPSPCTDRMSMDTTGYGMSLRIQAPSVSVSNRIQ